MVTRHPLPSLAVGLVLAVIACLFLFARPGYEPAVQVEQVELTAEPHHSVSEVRRVFAAAGIDLTGATRPPDAAWSTLGVGPPPWDEKDLYVDVFDPKGSLGLGHGEWEKAYFEERVGNVLVHYGGTDEATLARIQDSIARLAAD
jgi:hypothetical protein